MPARRSPETIPEPGAPTPPAQGGPRASHRGRAAGGRRLRVISREPLETAFDLALSRAIRRHLGPIDPLRAASLRETALRQFLRLVRENVRDLVGIPKSEFLKRLQHSRDTILSQREEALAELSRLRLRSEVFQGLREADGRSREQGTPAGFDALLGGALAGLFDRARRGELDLDELQREVGLVASELAHDDVERTLGERSRDHEERAAMFERRIAKLNEALTRQEQALVSMRRLKDGDPGIASIYRNVQGLDADDARWEMKHDLLVRIFEANVALRDAVAGSAADRE